MLVGMVCSSAAPEKNVGQSEMTRDPGREGELVDRPRWHTVTTPPLAKPGDTLPVQSR